MERRGRLAPCGSRRPMVFVRLSPASGHVPLGHSARSLRCAGKRPSAATDEDDPGEVGIRFPAASLSRTPSTSGNVRLTPGLGRRSVCGFKF